MNLSEALQIRPGVTAIIGGGGKTTLMERLAHELSGKARVIVCTTTHIYPEKTMPCLVSPAQAEIAAALEKSPCICVGAWSENGKFGPPELPVGTLARLADYVIVEADGAKRLPLKAHAAHEPVIPPEANQTILVVGASGFRRPMCETVHRAPLAAQALGVPESVIALTFVAIGTSLPELVTAITSLVKGCSDLSLGNIVGANVFNLVLVSGASVTIAPFTIPQSSTLFGINSSLVLDLPVMLAVMVLMCVPALVRGKLSRVQGVLLLCIYAAFCAIQFTM